MWAWESCNSVDASHLIRLYSFDALKENFNSLNISFYRDDELDVSTYARGYISDKVRKDFSNSNLLGLGTPINTNLRTTKALDVTQDLTTTCIKTSTNILKYVNKSTCYLSRSFRNTVHKPIVTSLCK